MFTERAAVVAIATNGFDIIWLDCIESHKQYAERYNFEYFCITDLNWTDLDPYWAKLQFCLDLLQKGRDVLLVDADAHIRPITTRFTDILDAHPSHDVFVVNGRSGRPNSGVVIFRSGSNSIAADFLQHCISRRDTPIPEQDRVVMQDKNGELIDYGENGHFIHFIKDDKFSSRITEISNKWNKTTLPIKRDDFIIHYTGDVRDSLEVKDGCVPFFGRYGENATVSHFDAWGRRYYGIRHLVLKAARKIRGLPRIVDHIGRFLLKRSALSAPATPVSADGSVWKVEASLGLLEHPTTLLIRQVLKPGDIVVDGGAHIGYLSRVFAQCVGPTGRVLSIEAHPENAGHLRANVTHMPVTVVENAITQERCEIALYDGGGHSNHSLFKSSPAQKEISVPGRRLDDIISSMNLDYVDFLKLDIEGAELPALRGLGKFLNEKRIGYILFEISPHILEAGGMDISDITLFLSKHGYISREVRDDYRLGPRGFINRFGTQNYLATTDDRWPFALEAIRIYTATR